MAGWGRCRRCQGRIWWGTSPFGTGKAFPFDDQDEQASHFESCAATEWVTNTTGDRYRVSTCRACARRIWWDTTHTGKRRPMDVEGDVAVYVCHLDTCVGVPGGQVKGEDYDSGWGRTREQAPVLAGEVWSSQLGLDWPCSLDEATRAFRRLAMTHHPDMGGASADFIRIRLAYDRLRQLLEQEVSV